jgi:hypothetical protein
MLKASVLVPEANKHIERAFQANNSNIEVHIKREIIQPRAATCQVRFFDFHCKVFNYMV